MKVFGGNGGGRDSLVPDLGGVGGGAGFILTSLGSAVAAISSTDGENETDLVTGTVFNSKSKVDISCFFFCIGNIKIKNKSQSQ